MKTLFTCLVLVVATVSFAQPQEVEMGANFIVSTPTGSMHENMTVAGGLNLDFM